MAIVATITSSVEAQLRRNNPCDHLTIEQRRSLDWWSSPLTMLLALKYHSIDEAHLDRITTHYVSILDHYMECSTIGWSKRFTWHNNLSVRVGLPTLLIPSVQLASEIVHQGQLKHWAILLVYFMTRSKKMHCQNLSCLGTFLFTLSSGCYFLSDPTIAYRFCTCRPQSSVS